jgi:predicted transcriptional regulator
LIKTKKNVKEDIQLSRRERQIMDVIYTLGKANVSEVLSHLSDPPGYNSVRVTLGILEKKGVLKHKKEGQKFVYQPTLSRDRAKRSALERVLQIFFEGSTPKALSTLLDISGNKLSEHDLDELSSMISKAKELREA